jgi:hypothetical protein
MSNSIKETIAVELQKLKMEGSVRAERIREIVRDAVSQAVVELKGGSGEIRTIVKDAVNTVAETVGEKGKAAKDDLTASIEGALDGVGRLKQEAIAKAQTQVQQLQIQIQQDEQALDAEIDGALIDIEATEVDDPATLESLAQTIASAVRERRFGRLQQQYEALVAQLTALDTRLADQYGDRYAQMKQQLEAAKAWYTEAKAKADNIPETSVDRKQAEFADKAASAGSATARKEQQLRQQVKELLQNAIAKL